MKGRTVLHDPLSNSMTDLMTSLAVIFILLLVAYLNKAMSESVKAKQRIQELVRGTDTKRETLRSTLTGQGIRAEPDPKDLLTLVVQVGEDDLDFDQDKSILKPQGEQFLRVFIPKLAQTICDKQFADDLQSVVIEGHTDSDGNDEHNLRLSQDRSYTVLLFALNQCGLQGDARNRLLRLISASGRGESDLLRDANGVESKQRSRRVSFKIRVKSFEQNRHLNDILTTK